MIDFLKTTVNDVDEIQRLWELPQLVYLEEKERLSLYDYQTIKTTKLRMYKSILFALFDNRMEILFKPHYDHNNDAHNANDFTAAQCVKTIDEYISNFEISEASKHRIVNIEFGLNFTIMDYDSLELLDDAILWKRNLFKDGHEYLHKTRLARAPEYLKGRQTGRINKYLWAKMYAKDLHHPEFCPDGTIRFELKSKKSRYINKLGIVHIGHLTQQKVYTAMGDELAKASKEIVIRDRRVSTDHCEHPAFGKLSEERPWKDEVRRYMSEKTYRNKLTRMKRSYNDLLEASGTNINKSFQEAIETKIKKLLGGETAPLKIASKTNEAKTDEASGTLSHLYKGGTCTTVNLSDHRCEVTGITLKLEGPIKKGHRVPKYIRTKTLKYLRKIDYGAYIMITSEFVPMAATEGYKMPKGVKTLLEHTAKQIKNRYYNSKRKSDAKKKEDP